MAKILSVSHPEERDVLKLEPGCWYFDQMAYYEYDTHCLAKFARHARLLEVLDAERGSLHGKVVSRV